MEAWLKTGRKFLGFASRTPKLYDKSGLIGASSHSGRRTYITRLIEHGADIKAVSRLAGHANIATTSEYVEDNPTRLKRIASLGAF